MRECTDQSVQGESPPDESERTDERSRPQHQLGGAAALDCRHVGSRLRPAGLPRHRDRRALRRQRARQGRAVSLHRLEGGAAGRHPRPGDGRGDRQRRTRRRGRRIAHEAADDAGRRAARRHRPLPRPRMGFPARVPSAHRRAGRAVPRPAPRSSSARVEAILEHGIAAGEFREVDPRLTALAWLGMHNYTYLWLNRRRRPHRTRRGEPFADIFIAGIARPKKAAPKKKS